MPQERIFPLEASHSEMVKPPSAESQHYLTVLHCLQSIIHHLPNTRPIARPPVAPTPPTGTVPLVTPKFNDFKGYVHMFKQNLIDKMEECSLSDMMAKSPTALLKDLSHVHTEDDLNPLIWVHVPLNNTSWVNVSSFKPVHIACKMANGFCSPACGIL